MKSLNGWNRRLTNSQLLGNRAETPTLHYLKIIGLRLVTRNYRCRFGEVDLIMRDDDCLVFVEVRCRSLLPGLVWPMTQFVSTLSQMRTPVEVRARYNG